MTFTLADIIAAAYRRYGMASALAEREVRAQLSHREAVTGTTIDPEQITDGDAEALLSGLADTLPTPGGRSKLRRIAQAAYHLDVSRAERDAAIREAAAVGISRSHITDAAGLSRTSVYRIITQGEKGTRP